MRRSIVSSSKEAGKLQVKVHRFSGKRGRGAVPRQNHGRSARVYGATSGQRGGSLSSAATTASHAVMRSVTRRSSAERSPLIFAAVANLMAFGEHPPDLRTETERVRKHLEHHVSIRRTIASVPQRREAEGVGCVVDEIEATLQGVCWLLCVGESSESGLLEPGELLRVWRLLAQGVAGPGQIFTRRGHSRRQSARAWAAPAGGSRTRCLASLVWTAPSRHRPSARPSVRVVERRPPARRRDRRR